VYLSRIIALNTRTSGAKLQTTIYSDLIPDIKNNQVVAFF